MLNFKGKYILIAIDGTDSKKLSNSDRSKSHVYRFSKQFNNNGGRTFYLDGPNISGGNVDYIAQISSFYVRSMLRIFFNKKWNRPFIRLSKSNKESILNIGRNKLRIVIVGHSRGGLIAIKLAKNLPYPVYFMGLFDAVEMHHGNDETKIYNTEFTYHAMRDISMFSRWSWGNVGDDYSDKIFKQLLLVNTSNLTSNGMYIYKFFKTTHGGINGLTDLTPTNFGLDDFGCDKNAKDPDEVHSSGRVYVNEKRTGKLARQCVIESLDAECWIRDKAKTLGLKFL